MTPPARPLQSQTAPDQSTAGPPAALHPGRPIESAINAPVHVHPHTGLLVRLSFGVVARIVLTVLWGWVSGIKECPMLVQESNLVKNGGEVRHFLVKPMRHGERAV